MTAWDVAVRDPDGRTIAMAQVEAARVGDIAIEREGPTVYIKLLGNIVAVGTTQTGKGTELEVFRWLLGRAGAEPVVKKV